MFEVQKRAEGRLCKAHERPRTESSTFKASGISQQDDPNASLGKFEGLIIVDAGKVLSRTTQNNPHDKLLFIGKAMSM